VGRVSLPDPVDATGIPLWGLSIIVFLFGWCFGWYILYEFYKNEEVSIWLEDEYYEKL